MIDMIDLTGTPCAEREFEEAIATVSKFAMIPRMMSLPPELAVQMPNIRRCLLQGLALTERLKP